MEEVPLQLCMYPSQLVDDGEGDTGDSDEEGVGEDNSPVARLVSTLSVSSDMC